MNVHTVVSQQRQARQHQSDKLRTVHGPVDHLQKMQVFVYHYLLTISGLRALQSALPSSPTAALPENNILSGAYSNTIAFALGAAGSCNGMLFT